ncbi:Peptidyl-prolyl cis-trans isomerase A precursor [Luteitalea pratensis]|uniref:peptidylprolyl isomerase n=1 Tax=Luteitalea pratensis TaxID=1855912 RepID=A0A143PS04_LUTPR|nr:peptidylprolyl isomerase [Luteitalea pratensis]AMY11372.1 Peptidyl-prolyl cis-trans isomerase A precursor [Luteitalea pratensis]
MKLSRPAGLVACLLTASMAVASQAEAQAPRRSPPATAAPVPQFYTTKRAPDALQNKQVVLETTLGAIVIQLDAAAAPNHVGYLLDQAEAGAYDGTVFHRAVPLGIIQGGDPLSKDPTKTALYGTGGLNRLKREPNDRKHLRGAVAAVLQPNKPDSAGAQFFICLTDQPGLDGQFTVFGEVVEGLEVAEQVSQSPLDAGGRLTSRVTITRATVRDTPAASAAPFAETAVEELAQYRATIATTMGNIVIGFAPDVAPGHVRNFLRLAQLGVYDGTAFHRVVPKFAVQAGDLSSRPAPLTQVQRKAVGTVTGEFNALKHEAGIVSMARGDDPDSASTSFFICTAASPSLDGKYTAFGRVLEGMDVVTAIERAPLDGEAPRTRIGITAVTLTKGAR